MGTREIVRIVIDAIGEKSFDGLNEKINTKYLAALQTLARKVYEQWGHRVVGITGSAGKTTTKELTAHVLSNSGFRVLKSERNYNNGLGLPLSVLQMVSRGHSPANYDLAVLEMGMSSPTHELRRLVRITPPDVGVELMVAPAHLEYLGTIENVAAMKADVAQLKAEHAQVALFLGLPWSEGRQPALDRQGGHEFVPLQVDRLEVAEHPRDELG